MGTPCRVAFFVPLLGMSLLPPILVGMDQAPAKKQEALGDVLPSPQLRAASQIEAAKEYIAAGEWKSAVIGLQRLIELKNRRRRKAA